MGECLSEELPGLGWPVDIRVRDDFLKGRLNWEGPAHCGQGHSLSWGLDCFESGEVH